MTDFDPSLNRPPPPPEELKAAEDFSSGEKKGKDKKKKKDGIVGKAAKGLLGKKGAKEVKKQLRGAVNTVKGATSGVQAAASQVGDLVKDPQNTLKKASSNSLLGKVGGSLEGVYSTRFSKAVSHPSRLGQ